MILKKLQKKELIHPPSFLIDNTQYLTYMGSHAYGCHTDKSDLDVYGFTIPPKETVFPHLTGRIEGFGKQKQRFRVWQEHHAVDEEEKREWDFQIYNIIDYFHLCMENNPNMLDSMFTPVNCVIHHTDISEIVRSNRLKFLSKKTFHTMKGYAYAQLTKMKSKERVGKRKEMVEEHGFDLKFASHVVRLLGQAEMILAEKDLDLQRNNRQLIAIRNGEWTADQVTEYFTMKEKQLEKLYHESDLQWTCDEDEIKEILMNCLEHHYGSLAKCLVKEDVYKNALRKIKENLDSVGIQ